MSEVLRPCPHPCHSSTAPSWMAANAATCRYCQGSGTISDAQQQAIQLALALMDEIEPTGIQIADIARELGIDEGHFSDATLGLLPPGEIQSVLDRYRAEYGA